MATFCQGMRAEAAARFLASIPRMRLKTPISALLAMPAISTPWAMRAQPLPAVPIERSRSRLVVRAVNHPTCVLACWCLRRRDIILCQLAGELPKVLIDGRLFREDNVARAS